MARLVPNTTNLGVIKSVLSTFKLAILPTLCSKVTHPGMCPPGVRHSSGTLQRHPIRASTGREHRRDLLHRQRGSLRHLLQNPQTDHPNIRGFEPSDLCHHVRCHHLSQVPWYVDLLFVLQLSSLPYPLENCHLNVIKLQKKMPFL